MAEADPITDRLEDQINWYDRKSSSNQHTFKRIKVTEIIAAALIPVLTVVPDARAKIVVVALGILVTIFEGLLHLNQYQQNWITYRSTCEALKHEKYLYLGKAGPYATAPHPHSLLAERVESLVSQEHAKWASVQQEVKGTDQGPSKRTAGHAE
jgi:uncharacterized protein DUF4231